MAELINHKELAESRLATQFKESINLINYLKALLVEADNLEQVFQDLLNKRWIDTAEGVQLDIIGAIVGQPRILVDATILSYFGFSPDPGAQSFGTVNDPSIGGRFRGKDESTTGNRGLTDDEYRVYIRARIVKNSIIPTLPELLSFLKFLFEVEQIIIIDGAMHYTVQFGRILTANEKAFLLNTDLVPKVAAVGVSYQEYEADSAFGFGGIPTSKGFGSVNDPSIGGKFSSIIS
jgi:hypothetical protein